ncbi:aminopeptidase [Litorimonas cladophorae]|uniref:Aminopeptidase N n=1 Tax=Litorimonas cladophorae TaxID=1220491 RepID=A0A918KGB2_9PROT|nr:M1 family metallopeptidase [Litorimonas cladophorae]GGX60003.1 aminopeptidase [Litorimonas cladophorae]
MSNTRLVTLSLVTAAGFALAACSPNTSTAEPTEVATTETVAPAERFFTADKFTYANYQEVVVKHAALDLDVNFDRKVLDGAVTLRFERLKPEAQTLTLDTKDLLIKAVALETEGGWMPADYTLADADSVLGSALNISIGTEAEHVRIIYETSPTAEGLQWLTPAQTAGKKKPYLFSQAQAINARTMLPVQDTPAVRLTYEASLRVPDGLLPLMSASQDGQDADGNWTFSMPQPIPSYLIAIAVGDIKFKAINDTIGVYAEDYILDASAEEFAETPMMEVANTELYGPYRWGRYDLIVLPPSFPFGGMENPRLSFMTPTLIAGDKSLTNVVAHELAHSWSGNLVTNASWRDAWLNEGFTSYVENRVMEELYGERRAVMEQVLDMEGLKRAISEAKRPELTHLKLPDDMAHPDDAFTLVSYLKGANFLFFLEDRFGREAFDPFLKAWFNDNAFQSVTTEDFIAYLHENLHKDNPDALTCAELDAWVYGPGLPSTARTPQSDAFDEVTGLLGTWLAGDSNGDEMLAASKEWSTHEWLHMLNSLDDFGDVGVETLDVLDETYAFTGTANAETAFAWYMQAIEGGYEPAYPALEEFLMTVGRGKFIYRLYGALKENGQAEMANRIFAEAKAGYHPIAQRRISDILAE